MRKNNLKHIIIGLVALAFFAASEKEVLARGYFYDEEISKENFIQTSTLDLELNSPETNFDPSDKLYLGDSSGRDITIKNVGNSKFIYTIEIDNISNDHKDFCKKLELEIKDEGDTKIYDGELKEVKINDSGTNLDMALDTGDSIDYNLKITVPEEAQEILSEGVCSFNIRVVGWLEGLPYETAFWDEEELSNTIATSEWLIKMGYETAETLEDDGDENPELGFCNVTTTDKSENDGKSALQVLKWNEITGTDEYRITGYKQNEDGSWTQWGSAYNPKDYPERLKCESGICTYSTWASNEGTYAYFIEALDSSDEVIGRTIPEKENFTCTFTVKWPQIGSVIINEIMWAGSSEIQQDFWVELLNTTDEDIDLTGWEIEGAGESDHSVELSGSIPANGYYLLTHYKTDHTTGSNFAAIKDSINSDLVDDHLLLQHPKGEQLTLKAYTGDTIDQTPAVSGGDDWAAGEIDNPNKLYKSMQRKETPGDGTNKDNRLTCDFDKCNSSDYWDDGLDENYGTPKSENIYKNEDE